MTITPEQLAKLPRYAKDHIIWLQRENARLNEQAEMTVGTKQTCIEVDPYRDKPDDVKRMFLPERVSVRYMLDGGYIDVSLRRGRVAIQGTHITGFLEIQPSASNSLTIGFEGKGKT